MNSPLKDMEENDRLREAGQWMLRLGQDHMSESDSAAWIEWCEADSRNLEVFESLLALWSGATEHRPDSQMLARLLQPNAPGDRTGASSGQGGMPTRRRLFIPLATAASLALSVGLALHVQIGRQRSPTDTPIGSQSLVATAVAVNQHAVLPDGSGIDVGGRTVVDVDFTEAKRQLQLRIGEAFFKVEHDPVHPFIVVAGGVQVLAVGTAFDVRRSESEVVVTVKEGVVRISSLAPTTNRIALGETVGAGHQIVLNIASGSVRRSIVDPDAALAWREGRLEFAGDSLDAVLSNVNRYSARPIRLADPQIGKLAFTGTVFFTSIDAWLDGLKQIFPVDVDMSQSNEIVIKNRSVAPASATAPHA
jgi:transmembrane sensor